MISISQRVADLKILNTFFLFQIPCIKRKMVMKQKLMQCVQKCWSFLLTHVAYIFFLGGESKVIEPNNTIQNGCHEQIKNKPLNNLYFH